jgi:hypothetical protein
MLDPQAVEDRQAQVHEDEIGLLGGCQRDAVGAVSRHEHREPGSREALSDDVHVVVVVLDVEDLHAGPRVEPAAPRER